MSYLPWVKLSVSDPKGQTFPPNIALVSTASKMHKKRIISPPPAILYFTSILHFRFHTVEFIAHLLLSSLLASAFSWTIRAVVLDLLIFQAESCTHLRGISENCGSITYFVIVFVMVMFRVGTWQKCTHKLYISSLNFALLCLWNVLFFVA